MKLTNNKGFTLIELIMVIVILGILSAVVVPKFFTFTDKAHDANNDAVYGAVRSGLMLYAAEKLVNDGTRKYPNGDLASIGSTWGEILDEDPDGWTFNDGGTSSDDSSTMVYDDDNAKWIGYKAGGDLTSFTLNKSW